MSDVPEIELNNGTRIPQLGFGVFQIDPSDTAEAVTTALEAGYRHIDTAQMYGNEAEVGEAVAKSDIPREQLWITTKCNNVNHGYADAQAALDESLQKMGLDHVDLYLIHWPLPGKDLYVDTWKGFEKAHQDGKVRTIGVSNFQPHHLDRLLEETGTVPAVNQIELHPHMQQAGLRSYHERHGIRTRGVEPDRPGPGPARRPRARRHRAGARQERGAGGPALARPDRQHRLPEVVDRRAHPRELRDLRLRAR